MGESEVVKVHLFFFPYFLPFFLLLHSVIGKSESSVREEEDGVQHGDAICFRCMPPEDGVTEGRP